MTDTEAPKILQMAQQACKKHDDIEQATAAMRRRFDRLGQKAKDAIINEAINWSFREAVYDTRHQDNVRGKSSAFTPGIHNRTGGNSMNAIAAMSMLDTIRIGNKQLGDMVGKDLLPHAEEADNTSIGWRHRAELLRRLAEKAGDEVVRKAVTARQCDRIWQEITGGKPKRPDQAFGDSPTLPAA